jgi:hypothetical protein
MSSQFSYSLPSVWLLDLLGLSGGLPWFHKYGRHSHKLNSEREKKQKLPLYGIYPLGGNNLVLGDGPVIQNGAKGL